MSDKEALASIQRPADTPGGSAGRRGTPIVIGMMCGRPGPGSIALALTHAAVMQGASLIFFNPTGVDIRTESLRGRIYDRGDWRKVNSRLPDVVINDKESRKQRDIWNALQARVPFTSPPLGDKIEIMTRMEEKNFYERLQIPTQQIASLGDLLQMLEQHGKVVAEPQSGGQGKDVFFIGITDKGYAINANSTWRDTGREDLEKFYAEKLHNKKFIAQRYIESVTRLGLPFDIRLHARRNGKGEWQTLRIYPRIGSGRTITSNYSAGGSIGDLRSFLYDQYDKKADAIEQELMTLASEMPPEFQKLYDDRVVDAIGIDIGLDTSGRPWLFEVNDFPWTKFFELEAAILKVGYALHLAGKHEKRVSSP